MNLRNYQSAAVLFLHPRQRAFIIAPAGSGKTVIAAEAASDVARPFQRVAWIANTKEQCEQARSAIGRATWQDPVEIEVHCAAARPDVSAADLVIIDECHHMPAKTWLATVAKAARIVWGFSATPWSADDERNEVLRSFFGPDNFFAVAREEVRAGGHLADGVVIFHDLDTPHAFDAEINRQTEAKVLLDARRFRNIDHAELVRRAKWQFTSDAIRTNELRNDKIVDLARSEIIDGQSVLVLVGSIEHGEQLTQKIRDAAVVHAKLGTKKRRALISDFRDGSLPCLVATSLADEGLDVPRASVLILAAGGRSAAKLEQRAGRVLRPFEGKAVGTVHDFTDTGSVMGAAQARAREKVYRSLGYQVRIECDERSAA